MSDFLRFLQHFTFENISLGVNIYALLVTIIGVLLSTKKLGRFWRTRHLRKVWGIRNGDYVMVVCSELDEPEKRQNIEPREFIYNLKYGDVDAYFEVVITLLRLYPKIKLKIVSAGEAQNSRINLDQHLVLIGGPDYNKICEKIIEKGITQYEYKSPDLKQVSASFPNEIVIYDKINEKEYCETIDERDYGYFERVINPNNPQKQIVLIGGCHTIGVTAAVKAFSLAESEYEEIPIKILQNAKTVSRRIWKRKEFSVLISAERVGQTINTPVIEKKNIFINKKNMFRFLRLS